MDRTTPPRVHGRPALTAPLLVLIGLGILALDPVASAAQSEVRGEILDKTTVRPIASAEVHFVDLFGVIAGQARSDSIGAFAIEIDAGEYQVFGTRDGCETSNIGIIDVTTHSDLLFNIQLTPDRIMDSPGKRLAEHEVPEVCGGGMRWRRLDRNWGDCLVELRARGCVR